MRQAVETSGTSVTVHVPLAFRSRGGRRSVLSDSILSPSQARTDNALLKALAKAHRWRKQIEAGEYASISELAKARGVNESYACRLLRLTLLAPAIVNEILDGHQRSDLMLMNVMRPFPPKWDQQQKALYAARGSRKAFLI